MAALMRGTGLVLCIIMSIFSSAICGGVSITKCKGDWLENKNIFQAGDTATIRISLLDANGRKVNLLDEGTPFNFVLTVKARRGNSSYISGISMALDGSSGYQNITFIPILVGSFSLSIGDGHKEISNSPLSFNVLSGPLSVFSCVASWKNLVNEFTAGSKGTLLVLLRDAFGNNISSITGRMQTVDFTLSAVDTNGNIANIINPTSIQGNGSGYVTVEFIAATSGHLLLHVGCANQSIYNSPFPFVVNEGPIDLNTTFAEWKYGINILQVFSTLKLYIYQRDRYGNPVPGFYEFQAVVMQRGNNYSIPITDMYFQEIEQATQLLTYTLLENGDFEVHILSSNGSTSISNSPYNYTVFIGYCNGTYSVVNGSGIADSVVGQPSSFSVYLIDSYQNLSPVGAEALRVSILRQSDLYVVQPNISRSLNVSRSLFEQYEIAMVPTGTAEELEPTGSLENDSSVYDVSYTTERAGNYEIRVFCGNSQLNDGKTFRKEIFADI